MKSITLILSALAAAALIGCSKPEEGPAEKAGKQIDQTMEDAKADTQDKMEQAGETMEEAEKEAGEAMSDAKEYTQEKMEQAGEAMEEAEKEAGETLEKTGEEMQKNN